MIDDYLHVAVLATPMGDNDAGAATIREYLSKLLLAVWRDRECFSGKRPFGNSLWEFEVYVALAQAGFIEGEIDEGGHVVTLSDEAERKADRLIDDVIQNAFR